MDYDERIINKAAHIWAEKMKQPIFDNGDNSLHGMMAAGLAMAVSNKALEDLTSEKIKIFETELIKLIKESINDNGYAPYLCVDYNPCEQLAEAADKAELSHDLFSCKSSMNLDEDKLSISFGYGAPYIYYYPIKDDKWLITDLHGRNDMKKIIEHVENGNQLGFCVVDD